MTRSSKNYESSEKESDKTPVNCTTPETFLSQVNSAQPPDITVNKMVEMQENSYSIDTGGGGGGGEEEDIAGGSCSPVR